MNATDTGIFNWTVTVNTKEGEKRLTVRDTDVQQLIQIALLLWAERTGHGPDTDWQGPRNTFFLNLSFNSTLNVSQVGEEKDKILNHSTLSGGPSLEGYERRESGLDATDGQATDSIEGLFGSLEPVNAGPKFRLKAPSTTLTKPSGPKLPKGSKRGPQLKHARRIHPQAAYDKMFQLCFGVGPKNQNQLTQKDIGQVGQVLDQLWKKRYTISDLDKFRSRWAVNWRAKDRATQAYVPPRPQQVLDLWYELLNGESVSEMVRANPVSGVKDATDDEYQKMVAFLKRKGPSHGK